MAGSAGGQKTLVLGDASRTGVYARVGLGMRMSCLGIPSGFEVEDLRGESLETFGAKLALMISVLSTLEVGCSHGEFLQEGDTGFKVEVRWLKCKCTGITIRTPSICLNT